MRQWAGGDFDYAELVGGDVFDADAEEGVDLGGDADFEVVLDDALLEALVGVGG
jgi:hypothetical protein